MSADPQKQPGAADHLVVNVEAQIAKRYYDKGFPAEAEKAVTASKSIPTGTPAAGLEEPEYVTETQRDQAAQA